MNSTPAPRRTQAAGTTPPTASPRSTPMADVVTSAPAAPTKIAPRDPPAADMANVASCVLSPSSARKMAAKLWTTVFQSMGPSEEIAQVARQQDGLLEEDLPVGDTERAVDPSQDVPPRADP